ncbi:hypothetical protein V1511DRAFT_497934 [Dipodascopsis uninucleata]
MSSSCPVCGKVLAGRRAIREHVTRQMRADNASGRAHAEYHNQAIRRQRRPLDEQRKAAAAAQRRYRARRRERRQFQEDEKAAVVTIDDTTQNAAISTCRYNAQRNEERQGYNIQKKVQIDQENIFFKIHLQGVRFYDEHLIFLTLEDAVRLTRSTWSDKLLVDNIPSTDHASHEDDYNAFKTYIISSLQCALSHSEPFVNRPPNYTENL